MNKGFLTLPNLAAPLGLVKPELCYSRYFYSRYLLPLLFRYSYSTPATFLCPLLYSTPATKILLLQRGVTE